MCAARRGSDGMPLAAIPFTDGATASARGADYLQGIIWALGNESGTAASTCGGFLADLLSLFWGRFLPERTKPAPGGCGLASLLWLPIVFRLD